MPGEITWTVSQGGARNKIEHIPLTRANANATDQEKESVRMWNLMVKTLRENGLMEERGH